jgi:hypothetical protein
VQAFAVRSATLSGVRNELGIYVANDIPKEMAKEIANEAGGTRRSWRSWKDVGKAWQAAPAGMRIRGFGSKRSESKRSTETTETAETAETKAIAAKRGKKRAEKREGRAVLAVNEIFRILGIHPPERGRSFIGEQER